MAGPAPQAPVDEGPQEQGQDQGQQGGNPQDQFSQLVSNLADGLSMLTQLASQIDPESAKGFDQINQQFQGLVQGMSQKMGGAGGQPPAAAGQGMSSPEAGGAAGARPAGPSY